MKFGKKIDPKPADEKVCMKTSLPIKTVCYKHGNIAKLSYVLAEKLNVVGD